MKRFALIPLLLLLTCCNTTPNTLEGTWLSDLEKTMQYNNQNVIMSPKAKQMYEGIMGRMSITFQGNTAYYHTPAYTHKFSSKERHFEEEYSIQEFTVLHQNQNSITLRQNTAFSEHVSILNFNEDKSVFWIYPASGGFFDINIREYFKKVQPTHLNTDSTPDTRAEGQQDCYSD